MSPDDLQRLPVGDLLRLEASLRHELARRGIARTATSFGGELAEHLAQRVYGGELSAPTMAAFDLIDAQGRRVQVKSRTLPSGEQRPIAFKSLDFDLAVSLRFNRETNGLEWACEFHPLEIRSLASDHADGPRLSTRQASEHGQDVTAAFRAALDGLDGGKARP